MAVKSAIINVMVGAALKAGPQLARDFGEVEQLQVSKKGPSDFVSMPKSARSESVLIRSEPAISAAASSTRVHE